MPLPFCISALPHTTAQLCRGWSFVYMGNWYRQMLCFALNHLNKTCAPGQRLFSYSLCIWIKMHLDVKGTRVGGGVKCKLACPWYPCQFILPVCQHCHPSVTWRQWWSCLSFGSCGRSSGVDQPLCMQCECPSLPYSKPVFILSR